MSVAQFDALLAILEPHIKRKIDNFCELSVQGFAQGFVLRDEVDEFDNRHSGFWHPLVRWLWTVKKPLKCLPWMRKTQKIEADPNFFYDSQRFLRQCVNVIDITWSRIYFSTCKHFGRKFWTQCAMTFRVNNNDYNNNLICKDACKLTNFSFQCCRVTWQKNERLNESKVNESILFPAHTA